MKNIVIVGAASAGTQLAKSLEKSLPADYRIVVIEKNEFAFWPIGALRAAVVPGFEKEIFASYDKFFAADSRHVFLAGYDVVEITANSVKLSKPAPAPFNSDTITVDVGAIATGSTYASPMRAASSKLDESVKAIQAIQKDVQIAKSIVVIGGGPVGVEFAGEVVAQYPEKRVTLIQRGPQLMPGWKEGLHAKLLAQAKAKHVDIRLGTGVELSSELIESSNRLLSSPQVINLSDGTQIETDFLFIGSGTTPNVKAVPQQALSSSNGHPNVHVDPKTLRVVDGSLNERWFALGDVADVPGFKTHVSATAQVPIVSAQIVAQITEKPKKAKLYTGAPSVMAVPFGPSGGAVQMFFLPILGEWVAATVKGKRLFLSDFTARHPGGQPLKA